MAELITGLFTAVSLAEVWSAVHHMVGAYSQRTIPVLQNRGIEALTNVQKANMLAKKFQEIHCGGNIGKVEIRMRN